MSEEADLSKDIEMKPFNVSRYALYAYDSKRDALRKSTEDGKNINDENYDSLSMSMLATNLDARQETTLRTFLIKRINRGMLMEGVDNGIVSSLDFLLDEKSDSKAVSYSTMVRKDAVDTVCDLEDEFQCVQSSSYQHYVSCLITTANGIFDFFRPELQSYNEQLLPLLDPDLKENLESVKSNLENWYDTCLSYICRCVNVLKNDVCKILTMALSNRKLEIACSHQQTKNDFEKFFESCCLSDLLSNLKFNDNNTMKIQVVDGDQVKICDFQGESFDYCKNWADSLLENNTGDPLVLKKIIEDFKLKTIQDMNMLKRMISLAENDHYALFRTYTFLSKSGYGSLLLLHAREEEIANNNKNSLNVIEVLQEFMMENICS